ncbi:GNAT family N-acetyltransferase [Ruegeria sp. HKCCD8929]|uniref:GNAT family N-acetyltransferase n=1 Tax=Ruegeria sp. HKCCD8929 TaxID=2683006 RepID=UPI0014899351
MNVLLRPARSLDAGATGEILYAFTRDNDWMPKLYSRAETIAFCGTMIDRGWVTVAENGTGVAGFLARDGEHVCALYLAGPAQGRGIGKRLLDEAKAGRDLLRLHTFAANTGARRFYLREGFREVARGDGTSNEENLPDIAYVWRKED